MALDNKTLFFTNYGAIAKAAGERYGIRPEIILAITAYESAYGTSTNFKQGRNPGGITWSAARTTPYWDGVSKRPRPAAEGGYYYVYDSYEDGFLDEALVLSGSRYAAAMKLQDDPVAFANAFVNTGYFTDANKGAYAAALKQNIPLYRALYAGQPAPSKKKRTGS